MLLINILCSFRFSYKNNTSSRTALKTLTYSLPITSDTQSLFFPLHKHQISNAIENENCVTLFLSIHILEIILQARVKLLRSPRVKFFNETLTMNDFYYLLNNCV